MPFSSARSVRAPASNATRAVTARVPGIASLMTGRPVSRVFWAISIMRSNVAAGRFAATVIIDDPQSRPARDERAIDQPHDGRQFAGRGPCAAAVPDRPARLLVRGGVRTGARGDGVVVDHPAPVRP